MSLVNIKITFIYLVLELSNVLSQSSFLTIRCVPGIRDPCPSTTRCNKELRLCECVPNYPIPLFRLNVCVESRSLGEECISSEQCKQIPNSLCFTSDGKELRERLRNYKKSVKASGLCKCQSGFRKMSYNRCDRISLDQFSCSGSHECMIMDLNTHCDSISKRCFCDIGFVFDSDKNQCVLYSINMFGKSCARTDQCQSWDRNLECHKDKCLCKTGYDLNLNDGHCQPMKTSSRFCDYGYKWDQSANQCRPLPLYEVRTSDYRFFSVDKLLETIVIVIFCFVTIAFMRFWRYILPQNVISESQTGMFSDFSHANRVQRRRSSRSDRINSLRCGRVVRLRVNLDSPEPTESCLTDEAFVALPLTSSHSSLPPYESAGNSAPVTTRPPYGDEPPTYEEAMALFQKDKQ